MSIILKPLLISFQKKKKKKPECFTYIDAHVMRLAYYPQFSGSPRLVNSALKPEKRTTELNSFLFLGPGCATYVPPPALLVQSLAWCYHDRFRPCLPPAQHLQHFRLARLYYTSSRPGWHSSDRNFRTCISNKSCTHCEPIPGQSLWLFIFIKLPNYHQ